MSDERTIPNWAFSTSLKGYLLAQRRGYFLVMERMISPLEILLDEIERALDAGFFYLAVATTLTLPDICVSLVAEDGRSNGVLYKAWCDKNLGSDFGWVTGEDLYSFRCGVSHNGRFGDLKHNVARVVFALPGGGIRLQNGRLNDAYVYSADEFCRNFMNAVRRWYDANKDDCNLAANLDRLVQYRAKGLAPYVIGVPLLA